MFRGYGFIIICLVLICLLKLCGNKASGDWTGREYMPDMAHSQAYEAYSPGPGFREASNVMTNLTNYDQVFADGKSARKPVPGTVARGFMPYGHANDSTGYEMAGVKMHNPFGRGTKEDLAEGKVLYTRYCAMCHGAAGKGKGKISAAAGGPLASIPNYFSAAYISMPEGKMYHTLQFGKNLMGSYASQMSSEERWKTIAYVKEMQAKSIEKSDKISLDAAYAKTRGAVESSGHSGHSSHSGGSHGEGGHSIGTEGHDGEGMHLEGGQDGMHLEGHGDGHDLDVDGKKKKGFLKKVIEKGKDAIDGAKEKRAGKKASKDNQH